MHTLFVAVCVAVCLLVAPDTRAGQLCSQPRPASSGQASAPRPPSLADLVLVIMPHTPPASPAPHRPQSGGTIK